MKLAFAASTLEAAFLLEGVEFMSWLSNALKLPRDRNAITDYIDWKGFSSHVGGAALLAGLAVGSQTHDIKIILGAVLSAVGATAKAYLKIPQVVIKA